MSKIEGIPVSRPQLNLDKVNHSEARKVSHSPTPVGDNGQLNYTDLYSIADDMSAVMAQFRRRADAEKRAASATDPFERILEENSEEKVNGLHVITKSPEISKNSFLTLARAMFPDDSDLVLVLRELIKRRKAGKLDTVAFEELLEEVWAQSNSKACQAGLNVGLKARLFSKKMQVSSKALRNTYREFLESDDPEVFQYEQWVEQYGVDRRNMVADFIETSLLHDIQSHDPSCSRSEFGELLNHVVTFKKLQSSDLTFQQEFLRGNLKMVLIEKDLLDCWFDLLQRPFKIKKEIEKNLLENLSRQLYLTKDVLQQKLLVALRNLDGDLFLDPELKQILIESLLYYPHGKPQEPAANPD